VVAIGSLMTWLAVRGVGFPQAGGIIAGAGALISLGTATAARWRPVASAVRE
jgi:hypothetical protein